jgi:hypothetical protein
LISRSPGSDIGHSLAVSLAVSLVPEYRDGFDSALTNAFEQLATELERAKKRDVPTLDHARQKLTRIVVRYAPGASREDLQPRFDPRPIWRNRLRSSRGNHPDGV